MSYGKNMEGGSVPSRGFFTIEQHLFAEGGPDKCVVGN